jgi:hypothetical protein
VNCSSALKWMIIPGLLLTLGLKLVVRPDRSTPSLGDVQQNVARFLARHYFAVALSSQPTAGQVMIRAGAGACRILVANSNPVGWDLDAFRRNATDADQVFVVFRGKTYKDQPTWLTVPVFLWSRLQRELGLQAQAAPLLAIIATPTCDAEHLPWEELG